MTKELIKINKGMKYRLDPTTEQNITFHQWAGCNRVVWNWALAQRKDNWEIEKEKPKGERKYISMVEQSRALTQLKKLDDYAYLKEAESTSLVNTLRDLDKAYKEFYRVGNYKVRGVPKFKNKDSRKSFTINADQRKIKAGSKKIFYVSKFNAKWSSVNLPKMQNLKFRSHRPIEGTIKNATISFEAGHWYISFLIEKHTVLPANNGLEPLGVDLGVAVHATRSDGYIYELPEEIKRLEKKIEKMQRAIKRKKRGSENWKKEVKKIAKVHTKVARIRSNYLHEASKELVHDAGMVVIEDLKIKNMMKSAKGTTEQPGKNVKVKSQLNRSIGRQGWSMLKEKLEYKADWYGSKLIKVSPEYTSQTCSQCGNTSSESRKTQADFKCVSCGHAMDADLNAAINILNKGLLV